LFDKIITTGAKGMVAPSAQQYHNRGIRLNSLGITLSTNW